ncbi:MAG: hypothetical protein DI582_02540 [Azospirillum brasilense]|nr:MAG: hypothetical protein DI582_02540 [Azospirillum brasilense]
MAQANTFQVRGGRTGADSEYGEGVPYYDTVSGIAKAWKEANPDDPRSLRQVQRDIVLANRLKTRNGVACTGENIQDAVIRAGQTLVLPAGNPANPELHYDCPPERRPRPPEPVQSIQEIPPVPVEPQAEARPLAQLNLTPDGARRYTVGVNAYDYFLGEPPRDPAAQGHSRFDRRRGSDLNPGYAEGTRAFVDAEREQGNNRGEEPTGRTDNDRYVLSRAGDRNGRRGEFRYRPSQVEFVDTDVNSPTYGQPTGHNRKFDYKFEENARFGVNENGQIMSLVDGSALISQDRRLNPYKGNQFTDAMTARNVITTMNSTAEGHLTVLSYAAIERGLSNSEQRFFAEGGTPTTQDAERMLQLNTQRALHPLTWSVSSNGVPVGNVDTIRGEINGVLNSPQFASLPQEDQSRLRGTYSQYLPLLDNPQALEGAIATNGGRSQWVNPLREWVPERIEERPEVVLRGYSDAPDRRAGDMNREERVARATEVGNAYADLAWRTSVRVPTETEVQLGTGVLLNAERQQADPMSQNRVAFLRSLEENPALRQQYINEVMSTPGALQKVTDPVFHATRGTGNNSGILAFDGDRDADRFGHSVAERLAGREHRGRLNYSGGNVLVNNFVNPLVTLATIGIVNSQDINGGRNQTRGIADGVPEAIQSRWNAGGESAAQIDSAFTDIIRQARLAEERGVPMAATSLTLAVNPNLNEDKNNGRMTDSYRAFIGALPEAGRNAVYDQMVVNQPGLAGRIEVGTEQRILAGERIATVDASTIETARAANGNPIVIPAGALTASGLTSGVPADGRPTATAGIPAGAEAPAAGPVDLTAGLPAGGATVAGPQSAIPSGSPLVSGAQGSAAGAPAGTEGATAGLPAGGTTVATPADGSIPAGAASGLPAGAGPVGLTTLNTREANAAREALLAGNGALAAGVLSTANTPERVNQGNVNRALVAGAVEASPAMFSFLAAQALAAGEGQPGHDGLKAALSSVDRGHGENDRYADLVRDQAKALKAAAGNPEALAAAQGESLRAFTAFFADGEKADQRANAASLLAGNVAGRPDSASLLAGGYNSTATQNNGEVLAGMVRAGSITEQDRLALTTLLANEDPAARAAGFEDWLARNTAERNTTHAGRGISYVEIIKLGLIVYGVTRPDKPGDTPFNPVDPEGCGTVLRPICPDRPIPNLPNMPNMPSVPGRG